MSNLITIPTSDPLGLAERLSIGLGVPAEVRLATVAELTSPCGHDILLVQAETAQ